MFKFGRKWSWQSVRKTCIECNWYTEGTNEDYHEMFRFVETHKPTDRNIAKVADDIYKHSNKTDRELKEVAYVLALTAVSIVLVEE